MPKDLWMAVVKKWGGGVAVKYLNGTEVVIKWMSRKGDPVNWMYTVEIRESEKTTKKLLIPHYAFMLLAEEGHADQ